jgi:hypothetical protein
VLLNGDTNVQAFPDVRARQDCRPRNQVCKTDDTSARGKTRVIRTAIAGAGSARERHSGGNRSAVVGERRGRVAVGIGLGKEISGLLLGGC